MKYVPSALVGQLSKSQGSTTAAHNRYGSYFRNRVIPVNPNTALQAATRSLLTAFSQTWRTLTANQRLGWQSLSELQPITDSQGQSIVLAGNVYYNKFNIQRNSVGLAQLNDAPALVELPPSPTDINANPDSATPEILVTPGGSGETATNFWLIRATAPLSAGVGFIRQSDYRNVKQIAANTAIPTDLTADYEAIFGTAWRTATGQNIGFQVVGVSDSGFIGGSVNQLAEIV